MKNLKVVLAWCILFSMMLHYSPAIKANAATEYITVEEFAGQLAKELKLKTAEGVEASGYVNALLQKNIIEENQFSSYTKNITRTDALVLMNKADEYLYGDTVDAKLLETVIEKRISDITSIKKWKREHVAKAYIKGYMAGYKTEDYCTSREMRGSKKITRTGALNIIAMLKDQSKRGKVAPDGQLIRTTNLPINAERFPYILASYPNEFYEWKLRSDITFLTPAGSDKSRPLIKNVEYFDPVDIDLCPDYDGNFKQVKEQYLEQWVETVKTYIQLAFNVDYRTVDEEWVNAVKETSIYGIKRNDPTDLRIRMYLENMKKNKTIIECDKFAVDGSTLFYCEPEYFIRVYIRYRIISSEAKENYSDRDLVNLNPYKGLIYTGGGYINVRGFEYGEWQEECFDIPIMDLSNICTGEDMRVGNFDMSVGSYQDDKLR